jgi:hypothetical protein
MHPFSSILQDHAACMATSTQEIFRRASGKATSAVDMCGCLSARGPPAATRTSRDMPQAMSILQTPAAQCSAVADACNATHGWATDQVGYELCDQWLHTDAPDAQERRERR